LPCAKGRDRVQKRLVALLGTTGGLAVNGDHVFGQPRKRHYPGGKATLETLRIQRSKQIAQMVVRGCAFGKGQKTAQQFALFYPEQRNVYEGLGSGQRRQ